MPQYRGHGLTHDGRAGVYPHEVTVYVCGPEELLEFARLETLIVMFDRMISGKVLAKLFASLLVTVLRPSMSKLRRELRRSRLRAGQC